MKICSKFLVVVPLLVYGSQLPTLTVQDAASLYSSLLFILYLP